LAVQRAWRWQKRQQGRDIQNTRKIFGDIEVIVPILVMKAGLVYDSYKRDRLPALWAEAEKKAPTVNPTFKAGDFFFQEEIQGKGALWFSFRYYTPKSNIKT